MSLSLLMALALAVPAAGGHQGREATKDPAVRALEKQLAENPGDLALRDKLLFAYLLDWSPEGRAARAPHVHWVIANAPDSDLAGRGYADFDHWREPEEYERAKAVWLSHVETRGTDAKVLANASHFFLMSDGSLAQELLVRAAKLEPDNPEWRQRLGHLHSLGDSDRTPSPQAARAALEHYEAAADRAENDSDRYRTLGDMADTAYRAGDRSKAEAYARELLELAEASPRDWNYGNAIDGGHRVLGHLALDQGDVRSAKEHLLAAGATPGSPQLDSFGPELTLAKALLAANERATVVAYLKACARFWKTRVPQLQEWIAAIEAGKTPDLDRFAFSADAPQP